MIEVLLISIFYLLIGSIEDIKKHEVYDYLNFSYFFIMLIILMINFVFSNINIIDSFLNIFIIVLFGFIMYFFNQWGGGDAKLMFGLSMAVTLLGIKYYDFLFNLVIAGGIYSMLCLFYYITKSFSKIKYKLVEQKKKIIFLLVLDFVSMFVFFSVNIYIINYFAMLFVVISFMVFIIYLAKLSEEYLFKKEVGIEDVVEGDWIIEHINYENETLYDPKKENGIPLSTIKRIKLLVKDGKIDNKFFVKNGIAYFPGIFGGFILSVLGYSFFDLFISLII